MKGINYVFIYYILTPHIHYFNNGFLFHSKFKRPRNLPCYYNTYTPKFAPHLNINESQVNKIFKIQFSNFI